MTPKKSSDGVGIREVYELVESKVSKVDASLLRLETKFDTLESGRLSVLESKVANGEGKMMMVPLIITIALNTFFFIIQYVLKK